LKGNQTMQEIITTKVLMKKDPKLLILKIKSYQKDNFKHKQLIQVIIFKIQYKKMPNFVHKDNLRLVEVIFRATLATKMILLKNKVISEPKELLFPITWLYQREIFQGKLTMVKITLTLVLRKWSSLDLKDK
jgi:hypothetical protein